MARAKSILVAFDGSQAGHRALDAAADLVGYGSALAVVGVRNSPSEDPLVEAARYLSGRHVLARYIQGNGDPTDTLLATATNVSADLIVIAGLNGSLARLVRRAPCDVLLVR